MLYARTSVFVARVRGSLANLASVLEAEINSSSEHYSTPSLRVWCGRKNTEVQVFACLRLGLHVMCIQWSYNVAPSVLRLSHHINPLESYIKELPQIAQLNQSEGSRLLVDELSHAIGSRTQSTRSDVWNRALRGDHLIRTFTALTRVSRARHARTHCMVEVSPSERASL